MNSSSEQKQIVYISLGCDCAVAYHLRLLNLVDQSFPFDWNSTNKIEMILETLNNKFSNFFEYEIKDQSSNFDNSNINVKSLIRLITVNKIIFPHESVGDVLDKELFKEKYTRRIKRFEDIVKNENIFKIFIRTDNKKLTDDKKDKLIESLDRFGAKNYEIKFISYDSYPVCGEFDWKRLYINWFDVILK